MAGSVNFCFVHCIISSTFERHTDQSLALRLCHDHVHRGLAQSPPTPPCLLLFLLVIAENVHKLMDAVSDHVVHSRAAENSAKLVTGFHISLMRLAISGWMMNPVQSSSLLYSLT